jgi:uncharacterized protein (TIGR02246 family)
MFATLAKIDDGYQARFERCLKQPADKVWASLTEPQKLANWLADAEIELRTGGRLELTFSKTEGNVVVSTISELIPLSVFEFTWGQGRVRFELHPQNEECLLVLRQSFAELNEQIPQELAGWHVHLGILLSSLKGKTIDFSYRLWEELYDLYAKMQRLSFPAEVISPGPAYSPSRDETEVRALYQQLIEGWNSRSADAMSAPFTEDGELIGFDGSQLTGRAEIASHLRQIFADHPTPPYVCKVRGVRFLDPAVAVLRAVAGMVPPGKSDIEPSLNTHHTVVAVKSEGKWSIALFQNTPAQFHGRPELVRELTEELRQLLS